MRAELDIHTSEQLQSFAIHLGAPLQFPENGPTNIDVPVVPHVFYCTDLFLMQPDEAIEHTIALLAVTGNDTLRLPVVSIPYENETVNAIHLNGVMVMLGHAMTTGSHDEAWKFLGSGRPVSDTVMAFQHIAQTIHWPSLDVVIACRPPHERLTNKNVVTTFHRTMIPVIRPTSPAVVRNEHSYQSELKRGDGATLYVAADAWEDVQWWLNYWSYFPRADTIPRWAREPTG